MLKLRSLTKHTYRVRRIGALKPKFNVGQCVKFHMEVDDEQLTFCGTVKGFAYITPGYSCMAGNGSGVTPSPGFSYSISFSNDAYDIIDEHELLPAEEALCGQDV